MISSTDDRSRHQARLVAWAAVLAALLLFMMFGRVPARTKFWESFFHAGHVPLFGLVAVSILGMLRERGASLAAPGPWWAAFAVSVALGATTGMVLRLVMGGALRLATIGVAIGLVGAALLGRAMQAVLVDTNPADPMILAGAAALLMSVGLLAGWLPARRAARVDPAIALRAD